LRFADFFGNIIWIIKYSIVIFVSAKQINQVKVYPGILSRMTGVFIYQEYQKMALHQTLLYRT